MLTKSWPISCLMGCAQAAHFSMGRIMKNWVVQSHPSPLPYVNKWLKHLERFWKIIPSQALCSSAVTFQASFWWILVLKISPKKGRNRNQDRQVPWANHVIWAAQSKTKTIALFRCTGYIILLSLTSISMYIRSHGSPRTKDKTFLVTIVTIARICGLSSSVWCLVSIMWCFVVLWNTCIFLKLWYPKSMGLFPFSHEKD